MAALVSVSRLQAGFGRRQFQVSRPTLRTGRPPDLGQVEVPQSRGIRGRGWTDPEGSRRHIDALLLGYYTDDGRLHYAGRAGTGMGVKELKRLAGVLAPLQVPKMPLAAPPPRDNRFGSPLKLSKVHWVRPEVVVEVTYLTWTEGGLLRAVSYQGQREDKPARQVVRQIPYPGGGLEAAPV